MNARRNENPPALGAEGQSIAVGAIALAIYAQSNSAGNTTVPFISPRALLNHAADLMLDATASIIDLLDTVDGDADAEDDDLDCEHDGREPEEGL